MSTRRYLLARTGDPVAGHSDAAQKVAGHNVAAQKVAGHNVAVALGTEPSNGTGRSAHASGGVQNETRLRLCPNPVNLRW